MRRGREQVLDVVAVAQLRATHTLAAPVLHAVQIGLGALGVPARGDRDDDLLVGDEVLVGQVAVGRDDARAAVVAELVDDLGQLGRDDRALTLVGGQDVLVVGDESLELEELVEDLLPLEGREAPQLHLEDRVGLQLVDVEQVDQARARLVDRGAATDQGDDVVERVERLAQAAVDVGLGLGLAQTELGAPADDADLVRDPVRDEAVEAQGAGHVVDDRQHVGAEVALQVGELVEVVEHDASHGVAADLDDDPAADARARLVAQVGDALQATGVHEVGDLAHQRIGVDLVRQLGDDELDAALGVLLDADDRAHRDRPATRAVHVLDATGAHDQAVRREVGALDVAHERLEQLLAGGTRVGQRPLRTLGDLTQVVRRDVGGHADGDAGGAVDQQVRDARRQHRGLGRPSVVVGLEVDGLLVDVAHHLHRDGRELALGVPHRGGRVVARRAEVALAEDHRRAHDPRLRQAHEGVVDRRVAVRVVLTHDVTHDAAALAEAAVGTVAAVVHRVEHATVHGLEAVAHVGQGSRHDDTHGVVDVRALHLLLQLDRFDPVALDRGVSHVSVPSERGEERGASGLRCRGSGRLWRCAG